MSYLENGERATVLNKALDFFERNPDEMLTRDDIMVKFGCGYDMAVTVARQLIDRGISPDNLPSVLHERQRKRHAVARQQRPKEFPASLRDSERRALEAFIEHGCIKSAAESMCVTYRTIEGYLKDARRRAGLNRTHDVAMAYLAATRPT